MSGTTIPFGGIRQSGRGREGSPYWLKKLIELKYVRIAVAESA
jgi:acyl-CoA reductase-like NAD-dependent aldehyde dehydrogenase